METQNLNKKDEDLKFSFVLHQIYIAANGVYSLEDKIQQLEAQVENIHEGMSEKSMSDLEDEVAKTVAQVEHSEHQVRREFTLGNDIINLHQPQKMNICIVETCH